MKNIYSDEYIHIISNLRNVRIQKHITQNELASILGVHQSFVSKVENRERRLDVVEFLSWIDALDVTINAIIPRKYI